MIYQINNMLLNVTQKLYSGEVNDVVVCQDLSAATRVFYTVLVVKERELAKKLIDIYENHTADGAKCYVACTTFQENYLMVFPYMKERPLESFFQAEIETLSECEALCSEVVIKCVTGEIPFPILYLQFLQNQVNKSKAGEIYFTYCLDLRDLSEDIGEHECATLCASMLFQLLSRVTDETTVSYMLLKKKSQREGYLKFIDLYKDIQAATLKIEKKSFWVRVKQFFIRNKDRFFGFLLVICLTAAVIALIMLLSQLIWGDIPLFRIFVNTFKKIGTESLTK